jgi:hypothetical protein
MKKIQILSILAVFCFLTPAYGQDSQRAPIDINLIIDGSAAFTGAKDDITSWVLNRLDQIIVTGDRVTVWNAGSTAKVVYTGTDKEAVKSSIRDFSGSGNRADFSGALREASGRQGSGFAYTLLICAAPDSLSSVLSTSSASYLRFSRIEEFSGWRAFVVGLNVDANVRKATADFLGS